MITSSLFSFAIIFLIAFTTPLLALFVPALKIPAAVLDIAAGIALGRTGFHLVVTPEWFTDMTKLGLLYLMFLAGLEIRIGPHASAGQAVPSSNHPPAVVLAAASFIATGALSLAVAHLFQTLGLTHNANLVALLLATTSLGVVLPILRSTGWLRQPLGQVILLSALFADFGTVALTSGVLAGAGLSPLRLLEQVGTLVLSAGAIVVFGRWFLKRPGFWRKTVVQSELGVRAALAVMGICGALALLTGAEVILGGFVAGLACSVLAGDSHPALRRKLDVLGYSLFLPLFFVSVGLQMDLRGIHWGSLIVWLPIYVTAAFFVKIIAALVYKPYYSWAQTLGVGVLMSTRFTLVIAVAMLATRVGAIDGTEEGALIGMALLTVMIAPIAFTIIASHRLLRSD